VTDDGLEIVLGATRPSVRLCVTPADLEQMDDHRLVVRPEDVQDGWMSPVWVPVEVRLTGWIPSAVPPVERLVVRALDLRPAPSVYA
jgi:hypothetical protein